MNNVKSFGPTYAHIAGNDNFLADMFSCLDCLNRLSANPLKRESTEIPVNNFSFILDDDELLECFLNLPDTDNIPLALDLAHIAQG